MGTQCMFNVGKAVLPDGIKTVIDRHGDGTRSITLSDAHGNLVRAHYMGSKEPWAWFDCASCTSEQIESIARLIKWGIPFQCA